VYDALPIFKPEDAADGNKDLNGDGYSNLEKYLNGLDPTQKIDWSRPANNVNRLAPISLFPPPSARPADLPRILGAESFHHYTDDFAAQEAQAAGAIREKIINFIPNAH